MELYKYGNESSNIILIQLVDNHDLSLIENEIKYIKELTNKDFCLYAFKVNDWNNDLSPWKAKAIYGKDDFNGGAAETLKEVLSYCTEDKTYIIGGYSLAGLFALWASYQNDIFLSVAAASPSIWFPDFIRYMKDNKCLAEHVYLSLGDKEDKSRNEILASISNKIKEGYSILKENKIDCILERNKGNHFKDYDLRSAKAFAWAIGCMEKI